jgi:phosphoglycolate phosphatase
MRAVLFDFDYTLADSSRGILACVHHALGAMELAAPADDAIRRTIGLSLPDTFTRLTGVEDEGAAARFKELYLGRARDVMPRLTELCPGVRGSLTAWKARGFLLGIVSTKVHASIRKTLEKEGLLSHFGVIVGGDDVTRTKPDPEGIFLALRTVGVPAERSLYVGDGVMDVEAARNARVAFVGVLTGTTSQRELERAGARVVVERVEQIEIEAPWEPLVPEGVL